MCFNRVFALFCPLVTKTKILTPSSTTRTTWTTPCSSTLTSSPITSSLPYLNHLQSAKRFSDIKFVPSEFRQVAKNSLISKFIFWAHPKPNDVVMKCLIESKVWSNSSNLNTLHWWMTFFAQWLRQKLLHQLKASNTNWLPRIRSYT